MRAALPADEDARLEALRELEILDTAPEKEFDDLALIASQICDTPISMISLIDRDRQWFKATVGSDTKETPRDIAFCAHAILQRGLFVIPDATEDPRFADAWRMARADTFQPELVAPPAATLGAIV